MKVLDRKRTIKYCFALKHNENTDNWHVWFEDMLAGRKLIVPILALFMPVTDKIYYDHKEGWANSIVLIGRGGLLDFKNRVSPFVWPGIDGGKAFFMLDVDGNLIKPDVCSRCGAKNPPITETIVVNGRAVEENKYCAHHGEYTQQMLIEAGGNG
jgi:hypothetical protein